MAQDSVHALDIQGLSKTYRNGLTALNSIDLTVDPGDFFALLGPNGAGKSTTIGIITSLVTKTAGKIFVFGTDIDEDFETAKSNIGLVPQEFNFAQFETVAQIVLNQAGYYGIDRDTAWERAEKYLSELRLWDRRNDQARTLSGGLKRRLMIARAWLHEPRLLILDEPTAGVDIELRRSMWYFLREINELGTTIILTTHYLEEAESLCRGIAIIDDGEIVENTSMKDLLAKLMVESFVFDLAAPVSNAPKCAEFELNFIDQTTIEVGVNKDLHLNDVFSTLTAQGIHVTSMRNKTNRLEELFLRLVLENNRFQSPSE